MMPIVSRSNLQLYNKCVELATKYGNLLFSFIHKDDITENDTHVVVTKDANTQILIPKNGGDGGGGGTTTFGNDFTVIAPSGKLGGYDNGDTVLGTDDVISVVKKMLQDGEPVNFVQPTGAVTSSVPASLAYEVGQVLTMNIGYTFNQNDAGALTSAVLRNNGVTIADGNNYQLTLTTAQQAIDALLSYDAGTGTRTNAVGEVFTNDINAGSIDSSNLNYRGIYPFFYGKEANKPLPSQVLINGGTKAVNGVLLKSSAGTLNINFNAVGEYVWFAVHKNAPTKNTYYKTALDTGNIDIIFEEPVRVSIDSPDSRWTAQDYDFYVSKVAGQHNTNMEIRN